MNTKNNAVKGNAPRLNFFDALIIAIVAIALIFGAVLLVLRARQSSDTVNIQYTILVKDLASDISIKLEEGQTVTDTVRLNSLGKVVSYRILPATYNAYNEKTKTSFLGTYSDMNFVEITIDATGVNAGTAYEVNGVAISVGSPIYFRTPTFTGRGYVTALSVNGVTVVQTEAVTEAQTTVDDEEQSSEDTQTEALTEDTVSDTAET